MARIIPLKGNGRLITSESKRILKKAHMRPGTHSRFNDKAKVTVAFPAVIIIIIMFSGIAGAGRGP